MNPIKKILGYDVSKDRGYPSHIKNQKHAEEYDKLTDEQKEEYNNLKRHGVVHSVACKMVKSEKHYSKY